VPFGIIHWHASDRAGGRRRPWRGQQPGGQSRREAGPPGAAGAGVRAAAGRPGHWFPLLLFGGLAALSLPLSAGFVLAHTRRQGDNDGMAGDDSKAQPPYLWSLMLLLDGRRPSRTLGWVSLATPVVTQAAAGAGHWAAGRRRRALAEWAGAAGLGLVAWGLGTEAPTRAEVEENIQQQIDLLRKLGTQAPATAWTETPGARRVSRYFRWSEPVFPVAGMVIGVPWRLRHPRRLTVLAIAAEAPTVVFNALRAARAVQRRRPRVVAGSALLAAGSVARMRAASAEPLR